MSYTWITPKYNWTEDDYYNLEDAQRIAGNICYLKSMAQSIYGNSVPCMIERDKLTNFNVIIYGLRSVNLDNSYSTPVVDPSEYTHDMISWLDNDAKNLLTLTQLYMLASESGPKDHGSLKYPAWYNKSTTSQSVVDEMPTYSDPCILTNSYRYTNNNPLKNLFSSYISIYGYRGDFYNNLPLSSSFSTTTSVTAKGYADFSTAPGNLYNQPFWKYDFLNIIELLINGIHYAFERYLGG